MIKHIPNAITSLNVLCGSLSIYLAMENHLALAALFIIFAAVFDFFDGLSARLLKAYSDIGKELDSLSDLVSFGVSPAVIIYKLLSLSPDGLWINQINILPATAFIMPCFAAWRLAIFNTKNYQQKDFIGLPVPANAIFFASMPLIIYANTTSPIQNSFKEMILNGWLLAALSICFNFFMIMPIPLFSLKIQQFSLKKDLHVVIFIALSILAFILLKTVALPIIILLYILISIGRNMIMKISPKK